MRSEIERKGVCVCVCVCVRATCVALVNLQVYFRLSSVVESRDGCGGRSY